MSTIEAVDPSDDQLRQVWREAGGSFHGPIVETGTMPESKLLPFLRQLLATRTTAGSAEQQMARAARGDDHAAFRRAASDYLQSLKSNEEITDIQTGI